MRHRFKKGRQFNRSVSHRRALLNNLLTSLIEMGRVETTISKAKELKSYSDRVISKAKISNLSEERKLFSLIKSKMVANKLFADILPRFSKRTSGFTRIVKLGRRLSDGAERARVELIESDDDKSA